MAKYTFLACDLRSNNVLGELPLSGVSFDLQLNGSGSLQGSFLLGDPRWAGSDPIGTTQPARTAIYVDRDGTLIWGGVLWTRRYNGDTRMLEIQASEFMSYFGRRLITDLKTYAQQDQCFIARDLVNYAQAKSGGNIGVTVGSETSGVLRDRTYQAYDLKPIGEAILQLSQVEQGFDYAIDVAYASGVPTKYLHLGYPRRGRTSANTGLFFEFPFNITNYQWPEDGTAMADSFLGTGVGDGGAMLTSTATATSLITVGYPLLEDSLAYKDISVQATLDTHVKAKLAARQNPITLPVLTVRADKEPVLGAYIVGDEARVRITDPRFPTRADGTPGLDSDYRITGIAVTPGDDAPEEVMLTMGATV